MKVTHSERLTRARQVLKDALELLSQYYDPLNPVKIVHARSKSSIYAVADRVYKDDLVLIPFTNAFDMKMSDEKKCGSLDVLIDSFKEDGVNKHIIATLKPSRWSAASEKPESADDNPLIVLIISKCRILNIMQNHHPMQSPTSNDLCKPIIVCPTNQSSSTNEAQTLIIMCGDARKHCEQSPCTWDVGSGRADVGHRWVLARS